MKNSGFTLLETVIYCALFSMLMTSSIVTIYALIDSTNSTKDQTNIISEAAYINQKLSWVFSNATNITLINTFTIKVIRSDLSTQSPLQILFENNNLYLSRGNSLQYVLNDPHTKVTLQSIEYQNSQVIILYSLNGSKFTFTTLINL